MILSRLCTSVTSTQAIPAHRFVSPTSGLAALRGPAMGVSRTAAAAADELIPVDILGVVHVEAAAAIGANQAVESTVDGQATVLTTGVKVARTLEAATAAGQLIRVLLIPN